MSVICRWANAIQKLLDRNFTFEPLNPKESINLLFFIVISYDLPIFICLFLCNLLLMKQKLNKSSIETSIYFAPILLNLDDDITFASG